MVNFRFHLVSLVAVFLALALGIGMGATVIDKATVDSLKNRVIDVESERDAAGQQAAALQTRIDRLDDFDDTTRPFLISGKLRDTSIVMLAIRGVDQKPLEQTREMVTDSGGTFLGTLWFASKLQLSDGRSIDQLQSDLGAQSNDPATLRSALLSRVSSVLAGATPVTRFATW